MTKNEFHSKWLEHFGMFAYRSLFTYLYAVLYKDALVCPIDFIKFKRSAYQKNFTK